MNSTWAYFTISLSVFNPGADAAPTPQPRGEPAPPAAPPPQPAPERTDEDRRAGSLGCLSAGAQPAGQSGLPQRAQRTQSEDTNREFTPMHANGDPK